MGIFITFFYFLLGFVLLLGGARILVKGAISATKFFGVSPWVIGVLVVGIGTSIPELSINIASAWGGASVGLGAIIGSNTFNTLFILGVSSVLSPIVMKRIWVRRDLIINFLVIVLAWFLAFLPILGDKQYYGITRAEGFILFVAFILWVTFLLKQKQYEDEIPDDSVAITVWASVFMIIGGFVGVFVGGRWVVDGAVLIAEMLGAGEAFISIAIVGMGTSLPELTISITAFIKKQGSLAVGNVIGSNIFDFLGILGIASFFGPISVLPEIKYDLAFTFFATLLLFLSMFFGKKLILERKEGVIFVILYLVYIFSLFIRIAS